MALRGLKVVEMAGLAPAPFAGMILAGKQIASEQNIILKIVHLCRFWCFCSES